MFLLHLLSPLGAVILTLFVLYLVCNPVCLHVCIYVNYYVNVHNMFINVHCPFIKKLNEILK